MPQIPLIGGSYTTRSIIASAQRCINYFPENNPRDSQTPTTHYQRPGLRPLVSPPSPAPCRGLFRATNGTAWTVIGSTVYNIDINWKLTAIGNITANRSNLCYMADFGSTAGSLAVLVDGSANGWEFFTVGPPQFKQIVDPTGSFRGADKVDYIDTFMLFNVPGTNDFISSLSNVLQFDPLYIAGKTDYADAIQTLIVNRHEILLLGSLKSEIWYDAGNPTFPFAELPGIYIEHGTGAKYSVCSHDISTFFLEQSLQGHGVVMRQRGYQTTRISNHAVEFAIRNMAQSVGIDDCQGYTYQQDGHTFVVFTFPGGDQTWVFDDSVGDPVMAWHQRGWADKNGILHRERANCHAFINGTNVVGDWENGTLYALDLNQYIDTVNGIDYPIPCVRSFPHIGLGIDSRGQPIRAEGKRLQIEKFWADIECGLGPTTIDEKPALISLRTSLDRGRTFGNALLMSNGFPGEYVTQPQWRALGIARHPVFELSHSIAGPAALNGAWIDVGVLEQ